MIIEGRARKNGKIMACISPLELTILKGKRKEKK